MMTGKKQSSMLWFLLLTLLVGVIVLAGWPVDSQAGSGLPNRNTPTPAHPSDGDDNGRSEPVGAYIELHAQNPPAGAWSVVQWQDANGDWQNVEGWQGTLNNGTRRWWVHSKDFGKGPFRWVVYDSPGGTKIGASESFTLPQFPNEIVQVPLR